MADGTIKIALRSPPADGKANRELITYLAAQFGTRASRITILSGATSRRKLVHIQSYSKMPEWFGNRS